MSAQRDTTPLFAAWALILLAGVVLGIVLHGGWMTWVLISVAAYLIITGSARWYLTAGQLPPWWPWWPW